MSLQSEGRLGVVERETEDRVHLLTRGQPVHHCGKRSALESTANPKAASNPAAARRVLADTADLNTPEIPQRSLK